MSPQVLGRCSEATKMGPPADNASWGGRGYRRESREVPSGGSRWLPSEHLGEVLPRPSCHLAHSSAPHLTHRRSGALQTSLGQGGVRPGVGEARRLKAYRARRTVYKGVIWALGPEGLASRSSHSTVPRTAVGNRAAGGLPHPHFCFQCSPPAQQSN